MAIRFDTQYQCKRNDNLGDPDWHNRRWQDIDRRMHARELDATKIDDAVDDLEAAALARLNDQLTPIIAQVITRLRDFGLLFSATSHTERTIQTGHVEFVVDAATRESFVATGFLILRPMDNLALGMSARTLSYDNITGVLAIDCYSALGSGTFDYWSIGVTGDPDLSHATRTDNPHQTTAEQVGAYTVAETDDAIDAAIAGSSLAPMYRPNFYDRITVSYDANGAGDGVVIVPAAGNVNINAVGGSDNIGLLFHAKGSGTINFYCGGSIMAGYFWAPAGATKGIAFGAAGGSDPVTIAPTSGRLQVNSADLTDNPTAATQLSSDFSTKLATTAFARAVGALAASHNVLVNGNIVESHSGSAATFSLKTLAGSDPSATDPVWVGFPDGSTIAITGPLSLTIPAGVTLGASNSRPLRLWWIVLNDNGTPKLGVRNCSGYAASPTISGFDSRGGTYYTNPLGNSAFVTYSDATAGQFRQFRVVAFSDYVNGLTAAGQWAVSPNRTVLVNAFTPMPGDVVQRVHRDTASQIPSSSATWTGTDLWVQITPVYGLTAMRLDACCDLYVVTNAAYGLEGSMHRFYRNDTTGLGLSYQNMGFGSGAGAQLAGSGKFQFLDFPFSSSQLTYKLWHRLQNGTNATLYTPWVAGSISVEELMM
jgi:hypothetical protein